jgi:hypothetical protein
MQPGSREAFIYEKNLSEIESLSEKELTGDENGFA